jgi:hypothetical protein
MGLDIRIPIGSMFAVLGALLAGYGLLGDKSIYSRSLGINLNLDWGIVLLVFGVVVLVMGTRKRARARPAR